MTAEPAANPVRTRNVGTIFAGDDDDDSCVTVDHVFLAEGHAGQCDCGKPSHNPGVVGLSVTSPDGDTGEVLVDPATALLIANRIARAASLALESGEELPDLEREAARYGEVPDVPPQEGS